MQRRHLVFASAPALLLPALRAHAAMTEGSGRVATEARALSGYDRIEASGSMQVVVRQGASEGVAVQADDNLLPLIETVVEGERRLVIRSRRGASWRTRSPIVVTVDVIDLKAFSASGSGDLKLEALKTREFALSLSGSGDATLARLEAGQVGVTIAGSGDVRGAGSAGALSISIAGSGDVKLADLAADAVRVAVSGSGDVDVTANHSLSVSIAGSGDVRWGGSATEVKSQVAGSGSVVKRR